MTAYEARTRIENELKAMVESFGEASTLVNYTVDVEVNVIEGAEDDITCVLGSLSIGPEGSSDEDKLYLPLDAELDDDDKINEEHFEKNLEQFKERAVAIRDRVLASSDYESEVKTIIAEFDREMDEKYQAEIERLNKIAKRNLTIAAIAAGIAAVAAIVILVIDKIA